MGCLSNKLNSNYLKNPQNYARLVFKLPKKIKILRSSIFNLRSRFYAHNTKFPNIDPKIHFFIHTPIFSFNKVKFILKRGLLTQSNSHNSSQPSSTLCPNRCGHLWTSCELTIVCYSEYIIMDYVYSVQNIIVQYSIVQYVFLDIEHYMFNLEVPPMYVKSTSTLRTS